MVDVPPPEPTVEERVLALEVAAPSLEDRLAALEERLAGLEAIAGDRSDTVAKLAWAMKHGRQRPW